MFRFTNVGRHKKVFFKKRYNNKKRFVSFRINKFKFYLCNVWYNYFIKFNFYKFYKRIKRRNVRNMLYHRLTRQRFFCNYISNIIIDNRGKNFTYQLSFIHKIYLLLFLRYNKKIFKKSLKQIFYKRFKKFKKSLLYKPHYKVLQNRYKKKNFKFYTQMNKRQKYHFPFSYYLFHKRKLKDIIKNKIFMQILTQPSQIKLHYFHLFCLNLLRYNNDNKSYDQIYLELRKSIYNQYILLKSIIYNKDIFTIHSKNITNFYINFIEIFKFIKRCYNKKQQFITPKYKKSGALSRNGKVIRKDINIIINYSHLVFSSKVIFCFYLYKYFSISYRNIYNFFQNTYEKQKILLFVKSNYLVRNKLLFLNHLCLKLTFLLHKSKRKKVLIMEKIRRNFLSFNINEKFKIKLISEYKKIYRKFSIFKQLYKYQLLVTKIHKYKKFLLLRLKFKNSKLYRQYMIKINFKKFKKIYFMKKHLLIRDASLILKLYIEMKAWEKTRFWPFLYSEKKRQILYNREERIRNKPSRKIFNYQFSYFKRYRGLSFSTLIPKIHLKMFSLLKKDKWLHLFQTYGVKRQQFIYGFIHIMNILIVKERIDTFIRYKKSFVKNVLKSDINNKILFSKSKILEVLRWNIDFMFFKFFRYNINFLRLLKIFNFITTKNNFLYIIKKFIPHLRTSTPKNRALHIYNSVNEIEKPNLFIMERWNYRQRYNPRQKTPYIEKEIIPDGVNPDTWQSKKYFNKKLFTTPFLTELIKKKLSRKCKVYLTRLRSKAILQTYENWYGKIKSGTKRQHMRKSGFLIGTTKRLKKRYFLYFKARLSSKSIGFHKRYHKVQKFFIKSLRLQQKVRYIFGNLKQHQLRLFIRKTFNYYGMFFYSFLIILERRIDNILCRMNFTLTLNIAQQLLKKNQFCVNDLVIINPIYNIQNWNRVQRKNRLIENDFIFYGLDKLHALRSDKNYEIYNLIDIIMLLGIANNYMSARTLLLKRQILINLKRVKKTGAYRVSSGSYLTVRKTKKYFLWNFFFTHKRNNIYKKYCYTSNIFNFIYMTPDILEKKPIGIKLLIQWFDIKEKLNIYVKQFIFLNSLKVILTKIFFKAKISAFFIYPIIPKNFLYNSFYSGGEFYNLTTDIANWLYFMPKFNVDIKYKNTFYNIKRLRNTKQIMYALYDSGGLISKNRLIDSYQKYFKQNNRTNIFTFKELLDLYLIKQINKNLFVVKIRFNLYNIYKIPNQLTKKMLDLYKYVYSLPLIQPNYIEMNYGVMAGLIYRNPALSELGFKKIIPIYLIYYFFRRYN